MITRRHRHPRRPAPRTALDGPIRVDPGRRRARMSHAFRARQRVSLRWTLVEVGVAARGPLEFLHRLAEEGVDVHFRYDRDGQVVGWVFHRRGTPTRVAGIGMGPTTQEAFTARWLAESRGLRFVWDDDQINLDAPPRTPHRRRAI